MGDISIKGKSPILRQGYKSGGTVNVRDINKDGKKEGWEVARAKGMAKGMGKKVSFKRGGNVSKRTSTKKDKVMPDRKRLKQNEKFKGIADEGRKKIRTRRTEKADGGSAYHKTKDGRTVKKGLYYYMNRAKKRGTSKPGKGSVTDKALKESAKTAKK